jgi:GDP-mannose pyrophosphatase NudK
MAQTAQTIFIENKNIIAKAKGTLTEVSYRFRNRHGEWKNDSREVYDNGDSAVVLPYDRDRGTVLLTKQLRIPAFLQDDRKALLEACAGKLEGEAPDRTLHESWGAYGKDHVFHLPIFSNR